MSLLFRVDLIKTDQVNPCESICSVRTRELVSHVWILDPLLERPAARQITSIRGRSRAEPDLAIIIVAVREMAVHAAIDWCPDDVSLLTCRHLEVSGDCFGKGLLIGKVNAGGEDLESDTDTDARSVADRL